MLVGSVDREQALGEVRAILVEQLGVDPGDVKETASFQEDLNADSLDLVELIMVMEEKFGHEIPDGDAETFQTVQDVVSYIASKSH